ncbi:hypothetical protein K1719_031848 [Acacia pycnantha]|nr:hypothetical protein K1719_031848 [Acacia pycnantha]
MSYEEFSKIYLLETTNSIIKSDLGGTEISNITESCPNAPSSLDWRLSGAVTNVKNQGTCGSCWAFSATGAIEGINQVVSQWLPNLSEQQLISCDTNNGGCNGGIHFEALQYVLKNGGIATERDYPYNASNGVCNYTLETNNKFATIDGYNYWWNSSIPENSLFCAVAKQPISVSFSADQDFMSYKSGIFDGANFTSYVPCGHNHAMLIVGYGSLGVDKDYWTVKNSWGTSWGQCGYVLIKRNTGMARGVNNINCAGSYPTKQIK